MVAREKEQAPERKQGERKPVLGEDKRSDCPYVRTWFEVTLPCTHTHRERVRERERGARGGGQPSIPFIAHNPMGVV